MMTPFGKTGQPETQGLSKIYALMPPPQDRANPSSLGSGPLFPLLPKGILGPLQDRGLRALFTLAEKDHPRVDENLGLKALALSRVLT